MTSGDTPGRGAADLESVDNAPSMKPTWRHARRLLTSQGLVLGVVGSILILEGAKARLLIRRQLAAQRIHFEPAAKLPTEFRHVATKRLTSGPLAMAYADLIEHHALAISDGRTFSEVAERLAADPDNAELRRVRDAVFMGESLRAALMSAYQAWETSRFAMAVGALFSWTGLALVVAGRAFAHDD